MKKSCLLIKIYEHKYENDLKYESISSCSFGSLCLKGVRYIRVISIAFLEDVHLFYALSPNRGNFIEGNSQIMLNLTVKGFLLIKIVWNFANIGSISNHLIKFKGEKKLKSKLFLLFTLIMAASIMVACGSDSAADGDMPEYTVAIDTNYVPFEFLNTETQEMEGFDVDLIYEIADRVGFTIDLETVEFDGIVTGMGTGRYDIGIAGMTITEERAESFDFSDPYYDAGLILAVREDETEIESIDDVDGRPVATRAATTSETYLKDNTDAEIQTFPDIVNAYQDLTAGRVDAVIYDLPNVMYYIDTEALGEMKTVGDVLTGEQYGIAFPSDSELTEQVNEALAEMKEDGTYGDIYEEWFGERPE